MMKPLRRGTDSRGKTIALAIEKPGIYGVWAKSENYCSHVHGGIKTTWGYIVTGTTKAEATKVFEARVKIEETRAV